MPDKWVPVTTAWRVLRFRMEERPPVWRVTANIWNKQSRTADKMWSSGLGVRRKCQQLLTVQTGLAMKRIQVPWSWTDPLDQDKDR